MEQLTFFFYNKKVCTVCKEEKSLDQFDKQVGGRDGLRSYCRECRRILVRQYFDQNPKARKRDLQRHKKYYETHKEIIKAQARKWTKENPQKSREKFYRWIKANPKKARAIQRRWERANPDKMRTKRLWRRARKMQVPTTLTTEEEQRLYELYDHCLCCDTTEDLTLDHIVPLAEGGAHSIENCQILCRSCNSRKGTQTIDYR